MAMNAFRLVGFGFTLIFFCLLTPVIAATAPAVSADEVVVRVPMPGRTVTAGYLTLINHSEQDHQLTTVTSSAFERVELHTHTHIDGMMRMHAVDQVEIPAGGQITLQPGGLHLMLFNPLIELSADQTLDILLNFSDGSSVQAKALLVMPPRR